MVPSLFIIKEAN